jgi:branched-chain amino acid transport system permease protein
MNDPLLARRMIRGLRIGLVGGVAALYLSLVGLIDAFETRNMITGIITLGQAMLAVVPLVAGYRAAGVSRKWPTEDRHPAFARLAAGAVAGAVTASFIGALVIVAGSVPLRAVLVRVSPGLIDFLAFEIEPRPLAALALVGVGALIGLIGAAMLLIPGRFRRPIVAGLIAIVLISMLEPFVRPRLGQLHLTGVTTFLYRSKGLTIPATLLIFGIVAAITALLPPARHAARTRLEAAPPDQRRTVALVFIGLGVIGLLLLPQIAGSFLSQVLVVVGLNLLMALGLNIVVGYAGLLDLGYVAFFAVGAYLMALLTSPDGSIGAPATTLAGEPWAFWVAIPFVMIGAAFTGVLIGAPVLRLRGDYLAIVTLGFGEIARILFLSDALKPWLGGSQGIIGIPDLHVITIDVNGPQLLYYPILFFCGLAAFVAFRLARSRVGRAWNAMREDEQVAEVTGVNTVNYKLLAFAMGATLGCLAGALFAVQLGSVFPGSFDVLVSITVLAIIILGGMGSIPGVIVGALVLIGLPELLREFAEYRLLVYGGVLVAMMLLRPEGLIPNVGRRRELHEAEEEEEQYAAEAGHDVARPVVP